MVLATAGLLALAGSLGHRRMIQPPFHRSFNDVIWVVEGRYFAGNHVIWVVDHPFLVVNHVIFAVGDVILVVGPPLNALLPAV